MNEQMNGELFDLVLQHALFDCRVEDIEKMDKERTGKPILSKAFEAFFHQFIAKRKRIAFVHKLPRYTTVAAVFVASTISIFSCILVVQPPVFAAVQNVFYEWGNTFVEYTVHENNRSKVTEKSYYGFRANYLPNGYTLVEASIHPTTFSVITYQNLLDHHMEASTIQIVFGNRSSGIEGGVDNEHGIVTDIMIDNAEDILFVKSTAANYPSHLMWTSDNYFFSMEAPSKISTKELKKIAENVQIVV